MLKATKKSISLSQSKCPLIKTIDCIIQSLGAVEVDGSYSMPPQLLRTGCFQGLILTNWSNWLVYDLWGLRHWNETSWTLSPMFYFDAF